MPISGLVLTLSPDGPAREALLSELAGDERIILGDLVEPGGVLPIVTETVDEQEHEALWDHLVRQPGVLQVRLAYHDFSDVHDFEPGGLRRRRRGTEPEGG